MVLTIYCVSSKENCYRVKKYWEHTASEKERLVSLRHYLHNKSEKKKTRVYLMYLHDSCVGEHSSIQKTTKSITPMDRGAVRSVSLKVHILDGPNILV